MEEDSSQYLLRDHPTIDIFNIVIIANKYQAVEASVRFHDVITHRTNQINLIRINLLLNEPMWSTALKLSM